MPPHYQNDGNQIKELSEWRENEFWEGSRLLREARPYRPVSVPFLNSPKIHPF